MKKLLMLLVLLMPFAFSMNVNAEEITTENSYLLFDMIEDSYFTNNGIDKENCYFVIYQRRNDPDNIYIYVDDEPFMSNYSSELNVTSSATKMRFRYNLLDFSFSAQSIYMTDFYEEIYYSNQDILDSNGNVVFAKNYPIEEEVEPTPSSSPEPDVGETDTSELEKCDSFVCSISEQVLDGFNLEGFDFLETVVNFLLILLFDLIIVSPFVLIFMIARWL